MTEQEFKELRKEYLCILHEVLYEHDDADCRELVLDPNTGLVFVRFTDNGQDSMRHYTYDEFKKLLKVLRMNVPIHEGKGERWNV